MKLVWEVFFRISLNDHKKLVWEVATWNIEISSLPIKKKKKKKNIGISFLRGTIYLLGFNSQLTVPLQNSSLRGRKKQNCQTSQCCRHCYKSLRTVNVGLRLGHQLFLGRAFSVTAWTWAHTIHLRKSQFSSHETCQKYDLKLEKELSTMLHCKSYLS